MMVFLICQSGKGILLCLVLDFSGEPGPWSEVRHLGASSLKCPLTLLAWLYFLITDPYFLKLFPPAPHFFPVSESPEIGMILDFSLWLVFSLSSLWLLNSLGEILYLCVCVRADLWISNVYWALAWVRHHSKAFPWIKWINPPNNTWCKYCYY